MDTHKLFLDFNSKIKLNNSKIEKLKKNRKALREKIRTYFKEKDWDTPKFYSQGSFPLNTNLNPIKKTTSDGDVKEEYDLDDGIYFISPISERKNPTTYHNRIKEAVDGHTDEILDKTTCVRVVYSDGHHIDLPSYWLENDGDVPQLAHKSKGFIESDPKAFKNWVENKISNSNNGDQLRRIIRYFKAWKNYRETKNTNLKLPSGFILTILSCKNYSHNERDDIAFKNTATAIENSLKLSFNCYRPTAPVNDELLVDYSKDTILKEFENLTNYANEAVNSISLNKASEFWCKVFGDRFPLEKEDEKTTRSEDVQSTRTKVSSPWLSC